MNFWPSPYTKTRTDIRISYYIYMYIYVIYIYTCMCLPPKDPSFHPPLFTSRLAVVTTFSRRYRLRSLAWRTRIAAAAAVSTTSATIPNECPRTYRHTRRFPLIRAVDVHSNATATAVSFLASASERCTSCSHV